MTGVVKACKKYGIALIGGERQQKCLEHIKTKNMILWEH